MNKTDGGPPPNGVPSDATRPVPAEADAADSLRVTLSSIGDGVITTDRDGRVAFQNPVAQGLTGWTQDEALGQPLEKVFHIVNEDTRAEVENPALRALREGVIVGLANHTILISRDGVERPIDDSAAPIRAAGGETAGAVLVFRDITERRKAERELRDSEIRYRRLFQMAKDGILILDAATGKITDANSFMAGLVGIDSQELLGKELHEIGLFANTEESKRVVRELQQNGYVRFEHLPVQRTGRNGETVEVEVVANIYEEDHHLVAQCNVRDISQRVAMERKISQQAEALAEESRRKDEFLAMLSHELRNPLAPIRAAVHLLRTQGGEDSPSLLQRQAYEIIERQVANLTKIINDLMEVSRVISGRIRLQAQTVDLNEVVRHAVETTAPLFERRGHVLTLHPSAEPLWTHADPTRMEEVMINLLNNAAKYTPDGGRIDVWCERPNGTNVAQFRVRDNGVGISEDLLRGGRIFDLFTQAARSLDRSDGGLGIGLSLAHRLVELHGGSIEAHSPPLGTQSGAAGSEFMVRLPIAPPPVAGAPIAPTAADAPAGALRILIVDDNVDLVAMLAGSLRQSGFSVHAAHTGPDGLRSAEEWQPDVLLLDIGLPEMDGYQVARRLRQDQRLGKFSKPLRLVALTGYGRSSDIALSREAGFDAHLVKPVDFDDLLSVLRSSSGKRPT
ncbi:MAG: PAS domain S-box protein [Phycisphaerae bacterium]|nr:PAS domain S-box protein [Phycisphaerae bacterium]